MYMFSKIENCVRVLFKYQITLVLLKYLFKVIASYKNK